MKDYRLSEAQVICKNNYTKNDGCLSCPFNLGCQGAVGKYHGDMKFLVCDTQIRRPPQSWCYVEEL